MPIDQESAGQAENCQPKPMLTAKLFNGPPYAEITIDPDYKGVCGEDEMLQEVFAALNKWRDNALTTTGGN